jgi:type I restriction enzyme S subunit
LAAAFRGDLTKEWREKNKDKIEPASELLKRIRVERRKKWEEEQLRKFQAAGKPPKDDSWKRKYTEPEAVDTEGLPELPEGWCWLPIGQLCDVVRGGSPRPAGDCRYYDGPIPFLKVADLTNSQGIYVDEAKSSIKQAGLSRTRWVAPSTLMLSNSGATLGVPKICTFGTTFNDGVAAFLGLAETDLKYHCYFWMSKTRSLRAINQGAAQPNLNTDLIANVMIPLCSIEEQEQVVAKLERTLSTCANISTVVGERLLQIDSLDQSILAKAFRGELVPQDPSEEPASVLLGRIKAEKEQGAPAKKTTKGKLQKTKSVEA